MLSTLVFAAPIIQIHSPQNTTYSTFDPIPVNVTSSEPADFYIKTKGKLIKVATNKTAYISNLYGSYGSYNYTIFANDSNGFDQKSVVYTINHSSIINVSTCGFLIGDGNTTFVLENDVGPSAGDACISVDFEPGDALNLNGFTIGAISGGSALLGLCTGGDIRNGHIYSEEITMTLSGSRCRVFNITMDARGATGITMDNLFASVFENNSINDTSFGIIFINSNEIVIKNITVVGNGGGKGMNFFQEVDSVVSIENSRFQNFEHNMLFEVVQDNMDLFLKNNVLNTSSIDPTGNIQSSVRMFKLHLLKITVKDTLGQGIPASVEIVDDGELARTDGVESSYTFRSDPSGRIFLGTDENGVAQTFVTENLNILTTNSPVENEEINFTPYTFVARAAGGVNQIGNVSFEGINSTVFADFTLNISSGNATLPQCTIAQVLDLDNNGVVNSKDAQVVLRYMTGKTVTVNGTKNCNGLNFVPVQS